MRVFPTPLSAHTPFKPLAEAQLVDEIFLTVMSLCQQFTSEVDFAIQTRYTICTAQNTDPISHSYLECQVSPSTIKIQLPCLLL